MFYLEISDHAINMSTFADMFAVYMRHQYKSNAYTGATCWYFYELLEPNTIYYSCNGGETCQSRM